MAAISTFAASLAEKLFHSCAALSIIATKCPALTINNTKFDHILGKNLEMTTVLMKFPHSIQTTPIP